jgi:predicted phosphodiesterase
MKFRLVSDLHLDFSQYIVPELPDDNETVLLVAGDICEGRYLTLLKQFLDNHCYRFSAILFVLGNHDYYGVNFFLHVEKVKQVLYENYSNVYLLDNNTWEIELDNIVVIGSTMWTDFEKGSPIAMGLANRCMADYMWIYADDSGYSPIRITPVEIYNAHKYSISYLKAAISKHKNMGRKVVVMTHHAPTWQSVGDGFQGDALNGAFVSDLSELILDTKPDIWCHGHTHSARDYMVGDTRVLCNPRGYHSNRTGYGEKTFWNPDLTFEI